MTEKSCTTTDDQEGGDEDISTVLENISQSMEPDESVEIGSEIYDQISNELILIGSGEDNIAGVGYRLFSYDGFDNRYFIEIELHPDRVHGRGVYVQNINAIDGIDFEVKPLDKDEIKSEYERLAGDELSDRVVEQLDEDYRYGCGECLDYVLYGEDAPQKYGKGRLYCGIEDFAPFYDSAIENVEYPEDVYVDVLMDVYPYGKPSSSGLVFNVPRLDYTVDLEFPDRNLNRIV